MGTHIFGCDICQDVCPWNLRREPSTSLTPLALDLIECSNLSEQEFHLKFRQSALERWKYPGFLRNVAVAMGNSGLQRFIPALQRLAADENTMVAEHARWAPQESQAVRGLAIAMALLGVASAEERKPPANALQFPGFTEFYNLDYDQALTIFRAVAQSQPSADAYNHIAQTIVFRAMFRANALDTEMVANSQSFLHMAKVAMESADDAEFNDAIRHAISLAQASLETHPQDTRALYALGVSHGLLGNYHLMVQKKYRDALKEGTAARKLHNHAATELDPEFVDARLTQGLNDYIVGSLPLGWRMLGFLGGFHGDRPRGIRTLELVADRGVRGTRSTRRSCWQPSTGGRRRRSAPLQC